MNEVKNIYQRINAIMQEASLYVKKGSAGQGTGVNYDEVISVLAPLLAKHGIVISIDKHGESRKRETAKGSYIFECDYKISYINIDNPADRLESIVESHAGDAGDKAAGKATTYASKISIIKVFGFESGDNEESRVIERDNSMIDEHTVEFLQQQMIEPDGNGGTQWSKKGQRLLQKYRLGAVHQLKESKLEAFKRDLL